MANVLEIKVICIGGQPQRCFPLPPPPAPQPPSGIFLNQGSDTLVIPQVTQQADDVYIAFVEGCVCGAEAIASDGDLWGAFFRALSGYNECALNPNTTIQGKPFGPNRWAIYLWGGPTGANDVLL